MAMRSISGPVSEIIITAFKRHNMIAGRERWISYTVNTILSFFALATIPFLATDSIRMDLTPCVSWLIAIGVVVGICGAVCDGVWPKVCYRLGWIESSAPPSSLNNDEDITWNPYNDAGAHMNHIFGHFLLTIRFVNMVFLVPLSEELFYRDYLYEKFGNTLLFPSLCTAFLWACCNMHYKGEWFLRFGLGAALQALVLRKPVSCGLIPSVTAQATRNFLAAGISIRYRRWYRWNI